jgi:ribosomal protein S18 acetylase RimI-like enzyme
VASLSVIPFDPRHLGGILALCAAEQWPSLATDPERAHRILTAPTASTLVAVDDREVIGFALAIVDAGPLDAYLSMLAVASTRRREGIARLLIAAVFRQTGAERIDLLAEPGSEAFYDSYPHRRFAGYRLYPQSR